MKTNTKNKKTSVIKLFSILLFERYTKNDILDKLNISETTFYKNISKLKHSNFNIVNENGFYYIENYKNLIEFDEVEKSILSYMANTAEEVLSKNKSEIFFIFLKKAFLFSTRKNYDEMKLKYDFIKKGMLFKNYCEKINTLEEYIKNKNAIEIVLHSNRKVKILPIKSDISNNKIILHYTNKETFKKEKISIEKIAKIITKNNKNYFLPKEEIIYELFGKLAKTYLLKKDERVIRSTKNSIVIAVNVSDKNILFKRLLRYDTLCKIHFPKKAVDEFKKLIDIQLKNIE